MALALVHAAPAQVVPVLGDVGEVREVAEGADHADRVVAAQAHQQPVEGAAGALVALQAVGDGELADALDQLVGGLALLLADDVAEDAAEQADVVDQRLVLLRRALGVVLCFLVMGGDDAGDVPARMIRMADADRHRHAREPARAVAGRARARAAACAAASVEVTLLPMTTRGDQILDRSLSKVGGKGLFVKELETALADGRADLAVHSLKDVPMDLPAGFALAAVLEREDPRDAWVSNRYAALDDLPQGARGRHVEPAPRRSSCSRCGPTCASSRCAATSTRACASSTKATTTRSCSPPPGLMRLGLGDAHPRALRRRPRCCRRPGRARWRSRSRADAAGADRAPRSADRTGRRGSPSRPSAPSSRALGGSCSMPLAAHARWHGDTLELRRRRRAIPQQRAAPLLRARGRRRGRPTSAPPRRSATPPR